MIVDCISDLHGHFPEASGGDMLIVAGDCTLDNSPKSWEEFYRWIEKANYRHKIVVAGNHDNFCQDWIPFGHHHEDSQKLLNQYPPTFMYLRDSGIEIEGLKIWGTPHSPHINDTKPYNRAFVHTDRRIRTYFEKIPNDTDILIAHSPFFGVLDTFENGSMGGSYSLREAVDRVKPKLFVCGHIHDQGGKSVVYKHEGPNTLCVNAAYVNRRCEPVNKVMRVCFKKRGRKYSSASLIEVKSGKKSKSDILQTQGGCCD